MQIVFDSRYAAFTSLQLWRARSNIALVQRCASVVDRVDREYRMSWKWVRGHSRNQWNELADCNAKQGADGQVATW